MWLRLLLPSSMAATQNLTSMRHSSLAIKCPPSISNNLDSLSSNIHHQPYLENPIENPPSTRGSNPDLLFVFSLQ
ncbi:hypothetical protein AAC387_Pa03g2174 [Persea americana]